MLIVAIIIKFIGLWRGIRKRRINLSGRARGEITKGQKETNGDGGEKTFKWTLEEYYDAKDWGKIINCNFHYCCFIMPHSVPGIQINALIDYFIKSSSSCICEYPIHDSQCYIVKKTEVISVNESNQWTLYKSIIGSDPVLMQMVTR